MSEQKKKRLETPVFGSHSPAARAAPPKPTEGPAWMRKMALVLWRRLTWCWPRDCEHGETWEQLVPLDKVEEADLATIVESLEAVASRVREETLREVNARYAAAAYEHAEQLAKKMRPRRAGAAMSQSIKSDKISESTIARMAGNIYGHLEMNSMDAAVEMSVRIARKIATEVERTRSQEQP